MALSELDELEHPLVDRRLGGRAGDGNAAAATELEEPFVAEIAQCPKDGVPIDVQHRREVSCGREPLAGLRLPFGDRATDLSRNLLVQVGPTLPIQFDAEQWY